MSSTFRVAELLLVLAGVLPAQNAIVQNAAAAQSGAYVINAIDDPFGAGASLVEFVTPVSGWTNIVAPGMLAVLS
jgi:hypothetical protein